MITKKCVTYADSTYNSKNPLKRFAHRMRLRKSLNLIPSNSNNIRLLDFGCGDGIFLNNLNARTSYKGELFGYEPYMSSVSNNSVVIMQDWIEVKQKAPYDYITCFEVLEHFTQNKQQEVLQEIHSILNDDGLLIISVPIEKGCPSIIKNMIRRLKYKDKVTYSIKNIIASFHGKSLPEFRQGNKYLYLNHMGFYFEDLEFIFLQYFYIIEKNFSPFPFFGYNINSQVFFKLKKRSI
jgi:cyclopropane fatty-acyl-phospholipid synthase-like methyltransferase